MEFLITNKMDGSTMVKDTNRLGDMLRFLADSRYTVKKFEECPGCDCDITICDCEDCKDQYLQDTGMERE